jgi:hypothetical protein
MTKFLLLFVIGGITLGMSSCGLIPFSGDRIVDCPPPPEYLTKLPNRPVIIIHSGQKEKDFMIMFTEKGMPYIRKLEGNLRGIAVWTSTCK